MKLKFPKYIHSWCDRDGKLRHYLRLPGRKQIPLPGTMYSTEFMDAYFAALRGDWNPEIGASRTRPGTLNAAIVGYVQSPAFKALADGTQKARRAILERFREEHGERTIANLDQRALAAVLAKRPRHAARNWLKTIRGLIEYSIAAGLRRDDPSIGIKLPSIKSEGFHTWTDDEIAKFERRRPAGSRARRALVLLIATGQRRGDVVRMGRQHVRAGILSMRQEKTGNQIDIPVLPDMQAEIAATPADQLTFLVTDAGKAFTAAGFGNWFRERCNEAGLPHCSAHGLRKAAATRHANAGATTSELMAWFGWSSISEAERYTRAANRKQLALNAAAKLENGTSIGKIQTQVANSAKKP